MWAFEHAGIVPDVVCLAKAIANGLPLSAIVSSTALQERWGRGAHGSTFGGNPVACAAGRRGHARRSGARASSRTRPPVARSSRPGSGGSRPRTTGSATSAGPGS